MPIISERVDVSAADDYINPIIDILMAEDADPEWLIPNLLLEGTLNCLAGEPGAGKSYVTYTMGLALASGWSALSGLIPEGDPRTVLYFDQENSEQDRNKYLSRSYHGLVDNHGKPDIGRLDKHFIPVHFALGDAGWAETAADYIEKFQPALMVFDTAASAFDIEDENSNAEASRVVRSIRKLMALGGARHITTIVLKHAKSQTEKGGRRRMRGATMWQSLADQVLFQVRAQGRPRKHNLQLTRIEPDKTRAYGLDRTIYITPSYTDDRKTGLLLEGSYSASKDHKAKLRDEEGDEDDE